MSLRFLFILFLSSVLAGGRVSSRRFHGYKVIRVNAVNAEQLATLQLLQERSKDLDFWTTPSLERPTDILVSPENLYGSLKTNLDDAGISFEVIIDDLERLITEESNGLDAANVRDISDDINWDNYHRFDSISNWLDKLVAKYPSICSSEVIGRSSEGRVLKLIKISTRTGESAGERPGIWIDAGIHAREWISPAVATFIVNQLVKNSSNYDDFLSKVDFYILPVLNPDGYDYTWTYDRMWRKTRSNGTRAGCNGVDANRNFGYKYGGAGTSSDPCLEIYRGPTAFSEPETRAVRDYILATPNLQAYITLHSYSQVFVYPWGYASELPEDWRDLDSLAKAAVAALKKRYGTAYEVGSSTNVLYPAAGGSDDWAKSVGIKYSYTIELRDTGFHGFMLPASQITPTALETWDAIQVVAGHVSNPS